MDSADLDARNRKIWFIRKLLDDALEGAGDADFINPQRLFDRGGPHPVSARLARAVEQAGYMLRTDGKATVRAQGVRRRLQLEDEIDPILVWVGARGLNDARYNSQARDRLATRIYEAFHRKRLVLVRIRTLK